MNYKDGIFSGIVEDNIDPRRKGRVKVRIIGVFDNIPTSHIPWSSPQIIPYGGSYSIPPIGKTVSIKFDNGDIYSPYYIYTDMYNINLQDKLDSLSDEDYVSFYSLLFSHKTQVYQDKDNFIIDHLLNRIVMNNDNINIELKDNKRKINIGTEKANQRAVLGDHFIIEWFKEFLNILVKPTSMVGNSGTPIVKSELDQHILKFLQNPNIFVSDNVYFNDNNKIDTLERDIITNEVEHDDTTIVSPKQENGDDVVGFNVENSKEIQEDARKNIINTNKENKNSIKSFAPDGTSIDDNEYITSKKDRKISGKRSKYNHENRNRVDRLKSEEVKKRKGKDNETKANSNYGMYKKK